jgi:hypothetical protein
VAIGLSGLNSGAALVAVLLSRVWFANRARHCVAQGTKAEACDQGHADPHPGHGAATARPE